MGAPGAKNAEDYAEDALTPRIFSVISAPNGISNIPEH